MITRCRMTILGERTGSCSSGLEQSDKKMKIVIAEKVAANAVSF